jgi:Type II CAAX prenyl endopeptidase Rce1-like
LARLTSFTRTALLSGVIQAVWHWPFVLFAGFSSAAPWWFALIVLTITVTLAAFPAAWLRLRSGSVWPVVLAHASFNLYVQSGFNPLTRDTGITEYIVDEFGVAFILSGTVIAYVFWRAAPPPPQTTTRGLPRNMCRKHMAGLICGCPGQRIPGARRIRSSWIPLLHRRLAWARRSRWADHRPAQPVTRRTARLQVASMLPSVMSPLL